MRRVITDLLASYFVTYAHVRPDPVAPLGLDSGAASLDGGSTRALDNQPETRVVARLGHAR